MDTPIKKNEEIVHGGQMTIVIGFIATFLLGVVFVFLMGNLLGQISDGVRGVNAQLSGASTVILQSAANACLNATIRAENEDILKSTDKNKDAKLEAVLNRYDANALSNLSTIMYSCVVTSVPDYAQKHLESVRAQKSGTGLSVETAVRDILY